MEITEIKKLSKTELVEYAKEVHGLDLDINDHSKNEIRKLVAEYEGKSENLTSNISDEEATKLRVDQDAEAKETTEKHTAEAEAANITEEELTMRKREARRAARKKTGKQYPQRIGKNVKRLSKNSLCTG